MARPGDDGEQDVEWDRLNNLALSKLKFYVTPSVHAIIWKGERLTAAQYYRRLWDMFLGGDVRAVQSLEAAWYGCTKRSNETLLEWWARFDALLAELALLGVRKDDNEWKAHAINTPHWG